MSAEHLRPDAISDFVMGSLDAAERAGFEAHVIACEACAEALAQEARVELSLHAIAEAAFRPDRCISCRRATSEDRCAHCGAARVAGGYRTRVVLSQSPKGRVYLAEAPGGARVALKELLFTQVPDFKSIEAFEREGQVLRQLEHPRIPRYIDSFTDGEGVNMRFYLAQSYVEGQSLLDRLATHRFDERSVRGIAEQVLEVLVYLQGLSPAVTHRDLKPSNLIQRDDDSIVLVDFGSARERGHTVQGTFAGTFGFAPPEQLVGIVDATSDLYALGMTLIHLLTRVVPTALDVSQEFTKANITPALRRWLSKMTAQRPRDRFASATAALTALRALGTERRPVPALTWAIAAAALVSGGIVVGIATPEVQPVLLPESVVQPVRAGSVEIESIPSGAEVVLDGLLRSTPSGEPLLTPLNVPELEYGRSYQLRLRKEGFLAVERTIRIDALSDGSTQRFVLEREPEAPRSPRPRPSVAPVSSAPVSDAPARPEASATPSSQPLESSAPQGSGCELKLGEPPGFINLDSNPSTDVYWRGDKIDSTPMSRVKLPSGCVQLLLRTPDGALEKKISIIVEPNRSRSYRVEL